jgi:PAS domain S-box-containing protein
MAVPLTGDDATSADRLEPGATRLLIVDDTPANLDALEALLEPTGCEIVRARSGEEALLALLNMDFAVIILDIRMPGMDGIDLARLIKQRRRNQDIPILFLTAHTGDGDDALTGYGVGAVDYLTKPVNPDVLRSKVAVFVDLHRKTNALAALNRELQQEVAERREAQLDVERANMELERRVRERTAALTAAHAALTDNEERFRMASDATEAFVYDVDLNAGRLVLMHNLARLMGLDAPAEAMTPAWWEARIHADDRPGYVEELDAHLRNPARRHLRLSYRIRHVDGSWRSVEDTTIIVRGPGGEAIRMVGAIVDVTERVRMEEGLREARRQADSANRAKDEFLAMLGHELRNPLAPMVTALELLRLRGSQSREQDVLERQVRHLIRMVDDLLDVSRITTGKVELQRRPVELCDVVGRSMEVAGHLLEQRRHHVDIQVPREGLVIDADVDRLAQVVANLLTNAAKYSDPGSRIEVRGRRDNRRVALTVTDQGSGILPEMLAGVFDAFVQQPQTLERSRGGLGLGLAIARSLVLQHGGTIRAKSDGPGRGSQFIVELPATEGVRTEPCEPVGGDTRVRSAARILVVDDNDDASQMLQVALEKLGYVVDVARDGPSALHKAASLRPDIALLDIGLPVMDGYELAERLMRDLPEGVRLRLVAITGYGQDADRERAKDAGFEHHLVKPIDLPRLERVIERMLSDPRVPSSAE